MQPLVDSEPLNYSWTIFFIILAWYFSYVNNSLYKIICNFLHHKDTKDTNIFLPGMVKTDRDRNVGALHSGDNRAEPTIMFYARMQRPPPRPIGMLFHYQDLVSGKRI